MTERDGYYIVSAVCMVLGAISVIFYMLPTARKLQGWLLIFSQALGYDTNFVCSATYKQMAGILLSVYIRIQLGWTYLYMGAVLYTYLFQGCYAMCINERRIGE